MKIPSHTRSTGFTLFELAIVLVIMGLLVGGILVGRELIRASELRAVMTNVDTFKTEISAFRIKYGGIPGDISNAPTFFGGTAVSGNGNSQIDYLFGAAGEEYNAWSHLTAASLIAGNFTGEQTSLPTSRLGGGMYRISYQTNVYGRSGNMISFNALNPVFLLAHDPILTPKDAFAIDVKMDDGLADRGRVLAFNPEGVPGCVTNYHTDPSGTYIFTNDTVLCKLFFLLDY